ncbi:MAG: DoxX family membrane protein [Verrucomicrobiales bacterium]|nr:DoxX family membrane protein [Verrucomicrobiales bacterium]
MDRPADTRPRSGALGWGLVLGRWFLGAAFIYLGAVKVLDPVAFLKQVHAYDLVVQPPWLNLVAGVLPWLEILCGLLLILGVAIRGTGLLTLMMLVAFTFAVWQRGSDLAAREGAPLCLIKFDCGCGTGEIGVCNKLVENSLLMALAALPLLWPRQRLLLCPPAAGSPTPESAAGSES